MAATRSDVTGHGHSIADKGQGEASNHQVKIEAEVEHVILAKDESQATEILAALERQGLKSKASKQRIRVFTKDGMMPLSFIGKRPVSNIKIDVSQALCTIAERMSIAAYMKTQHDGWVEVKPYSPHPGKLIFSFPVETEFAIVGATMYGKFGLRLQSSSRRGKYDITLGEAEFWEGEGRIVDGEVKDFELEIGELIERATQGIWMMPELGLQ